MEELKQVVYKGNYQQHSYDILCWEGTPLSVVWNSQKQWFTPGSQVMIEDNYGNRKVFVRGMC